MASEIEAKLKTLAMIIKFGHDLFDRKNLKEIAASAVNNSHSLLNFRSSALFRLQKNKKCDILGQFGQAEVNEYSAAAVQQKALLQKIQFDEKNILLLGNQELPAELAENNAVYLLCSLQRPASTELESSYIWLLEYEKSVPESAVTTAQLLGKSIVEALCLAEASSLGGGHRRVIRHFGKMTKFLFLFLLLILIAFIPVRESGTAEFMLNAPDITASYAWYDGSVLKCLKQDGVFVRKGETILRFDTEEQKYRLSNAQAALKEAEAELELAQQTAFTDESKLGNVKLLRARCEVLKVAVKEAQWYLNNSEIKAAADGILVLADGRAEQLTGKAVKAGDKLFEIYGGEGMVAEIMVNERDSSILHSDFKAELFLHTAPEKMISGTMLSVAQYPVLNEQNFYSYTVRVKLPESEEKSLRYGMRGIAKLTGEKVSLGYYLFKNLILYFRNW